MPLGSYEVHTMYAGMGAIDLFKTKTPLIRTSIDKLAAPSLKMGSPSLSTIAGASNLALGAAVVGVGLFAYLAAKALKK